MGDILVLVDVFHWRVFFLLAVIVFRCIEVDVATYGQVGVYRTQAQACGRFEAICRTFAIRVCNAPDGLLSVTDNARGRTDTLPFSGSTDCSTLM